MNLTTGAFFLLLMAMSGAAQLVIPVLFGRFPGWRVPAGAPVLIPRSGLTACWLAQGMIVAVVSLIAARMWAGDGCFSGVTGSPFCDTFGETAGRRLQDISVLSDLVALGAPVAALVAALSERAARRETALAAGLATGLAKGGRHG